MNEMNTVGKGECELCVCGWATLQRVWGAEYMRCVEATPVEVDLFRLVKGRLSRRLVSKMQSARPSVLGDSAASQVCRIVCVSSSVTWRNCFSAR